MNAPNLARTYGLPAGGWRWAALGFVMIALASGGLAVGAPNLARWAGFALLAGIGAVASVFLYAVWPRAGVRLTETKRVADAAARASVAWVVTGADGAVLDCNDLYRRLTGIAENEVPPPPELALSGEPQGAVLYRLSRAAAEGEAREEIVQLGPTLELAASVRPLPGGQAAWWFTPRIAAAQGAALLVATAAAAPNITALPVLFRDAPVGVALAGIDGKIAEANASFAEFFGLSGTLSGRTANELVDAADKQNVAELMAKAATASSGPIELRSSGETERMAELYASPLGGEAGRMILYLVDVSEQKALETKFAQSQKMQAVGQLAGGVAHDFNNLLTVIIGNSEFLLMRHQAGDPSFKEINEIHQNALRAATLVGQLLAFSRKQTLQPRVLSVRDVVGELALMLKRLLREGVELNL
jgi:two-component system cell cycle sensor histidine kinase/response regulator CckA